MSALPQVMYIIKLHAQVSCAVLRGANKSCPKRLSFWPVADQAAIDFGFASRRAERWLLTQFFLLIFRHIDLTTRVADLDTASP